MRALLTIPALLLILVLTLALVVSGATGDPTPAAAAPAAIAQPHPPAPEQPPATPAVPPGPTDAPAWSKAAALEAAVHQAMAGFGGDYSVVVHDLGSGQQWSHNPEQAYHPASTIKMPVALYALEQYRAGKIGWSDLIEYTPADFESPGGGAFETAPFGGLYPVENLVGRALRYSNNVAVNMLGRFFGWRNIEAWTEQIDGRLFREGTSPRVTALSELGWWRHLHRLAQEDSRNAELLLKPLREVAYDGRITAGLPTGVPHLHKFGSYNGNYHDGGIIWADEPYILVVMTGGAQEGEADLAIARVTAAVHQVMTNPS